MDLLVSSMLGRLLFVGERRLPRDCYTCIFPCTPVECPLHWRTCWATGLCARNALAALAMTCNALAIVQRNRLAEIIIIVQIFDDVTL